MNDSSNWDNHTGREIQEHIADHLLKAVFWLRAIFIAMLIGPVLLAATVLWAGLYHWHRF